MKTRLLPVLIIGTVSLCAAQDKPSPTPFADFEDRVAAYMKIHKAAQSDLGGLRPTSSPEQIDAKKDSLAEGVRTKRSTAIQGDVFTPTIADEFRRVIAIDLKRRDKRIRQSIRSGEPVMAKVRVNGSYPEGLPLQTMPPSLLTTFPKLPSELDYRLVGTTLVLRDVTANLIIDFVPNAIAIH